MKTTSMNRSASSPLEISPPARGVGRTSSGRRMFQSLNNAASLTRRQSSASDITMDLAGLGTDNIEAKPKKKGFFYSKTWREYKKRRNAKHKEISDEGSSISGEIMINRDLTRRKRSSFLKGNSVKDLNATNVTAYLAARVEAERPKISEVYIHSSAILVGMSKSHMLDVALVGNDDIPVRASRFILGCYSKLLEEVFFKQRECSMYDEEKQTIVVDFCNSQVLKAAVHHCFSGELPSDFNVDRPDEDVARNLAQLDHVAKTFQLRALGEVVYRAARTLINRRTVLACAVFDELSLRHGVGSVDSTCIKRYALDTMREMPMDTLLGGGVQWMKEESVMSIMQDQDLDVDEFYMFKILKAWEGGATRTNDRLAKARKMAKHIELKFIEAELIKSQISNSGYFEDADIAEAIKLIEETLANRDPHEMERVLVEGAGTPIVNGIYLRVEEELGMSEEEILFVKEADDGFSDVGLYLYGTKWNIAMCADYSNCFYSCVDDPGKTAANELVPRNGWTTTYGGEDPPPACTYLPNTRAARLGLDGTVLAPNLEEMMDPTIAEVCFVNFVSCISI
jgi:hypothetical protein